MKKALFLMIIVAVLRTGAVAQTPEGAVQNARDLFTDIKNRSNQLELMRKDADAPRQPATHEVKFPEIKEDFEKIQALNIELQPNVASTKPDLQAAGQAAGEIRKRATRLQSNLFVPNNKKKSKKKVGNDSAENIKQPNLNVLADYLEATIARFVKNSMFVNISLVNAIDSEQAQNDLEKIIKLSASIESQTALAENNH